MNKVYDQVAELVWSLQGLEPVETMWSYDREEFAELVKEMCPPIDVRIWTRQIDCGDGSGYPAIFKTQAGAERRAEHEAEYCGYVAVGCTSIQVTLDGELVKGMDYTHEENDEEVYE